MTAAMSNRDAEAELNLPPGFRFHPTDEELVLHYLCRKAAKQGLPVPIIADVDLYRFDPWDLPEKALFGQREWYFFTPRDRKYPNGSRPNRAAGMGYWKATGADKPISPPGSTRPLGIKKALVFYHGKAPRGVKTDWIMHEYRLAVANRAAAKKGSLRLDDWVLCRLYNKKNSYEKMVKQQKPKEEEVSFGETLDSSSSYTGSETHRTPESDSHRTPESDIEFLDLDALKASDAGSFQTVEQQQEQQKENNDWFTDLNLDDLQSSFGMFRSMSGFDLSNQDYCFSNQSNLPAF